MGTGERKSVITGIRQGATTQQGVSRKRELPLSQSMYRVLPQVFESGFDPRHPAQRSHSCFLCWVMVSQLIALAARL